MEIQVKEFTSPQNEWVKWADKQFNEKTALKSKKLARATP